MLYVPWQRSPASRAAFSPCWSRRMPPLPSPAHICITIQPHLWTGTERGCRSVASLHTYLMHFGCRRLFASVIMKPVHHKRHISFPDKPRQIYNFAVRMHKYLFLYRDSSTRWISYMEDHQIKSALTGCMCAEGFQKYVLPFCWRKITYTAFIQSFRWPSLETFNRTRP